MSQQILDHVESKSLKTAADPFEIGDTVDVHNRILEGNKERTQISMELSLHAMVRVVAKCLLSVESFLVRVLNENFQFTLPK